MEDDVRDQALWDGRARSKRIICQTRGRGHFRVFVPWTHLVETGRPLELPHSDKHTPERADSWADAGGEASE